MLNHYNPFVFCIFFYLSFDCVSRLFLSPADTLVSLFKLHFQTVGEKTIFSELKPREICIPLFAWHLEYIFQHINPLYNLCGWIEQTLFLLAIWKLSRKMFRCLSCCLFDFVHVEFFELWLFICSLIFFCGVQFEGQQTGGWLHGFDVLFCVFSLRLMND